jgi:hypothetical protein
VEHPDGRIRPGELKSGGYGYYYKGGVTQAQEVADPLRDLQTYFPPVQTRPRPSEPAKPYKELITSDVYFTNEKWQEVLSSHGIIIDADKKLLTIQSSGTQQDFVYDLTEEEVKKLTENSLKKVPLQGTSRHSQPCYQRGFQGLYHQRHAQQQRAYQHHLEAGSGAGT